VPSARGHPDAYEPVNAVVEVTIRSLETPGLLARLLGGRPPELTLRWEELFEPDDGASARSFALDVDRLAPGGYRLDLVLQLHTGATLASTSVFSIAPDE
jgi:hypothetical protein